MANDFDQINELQEAQLRRLGEASLKRGLTDAEPTYRMLADLLSGKHEGYSPEQLAHAQEIFREVSESDESKRLRAAHEALTPRPDPIREWLQQNEEPDPRYRAPGRFPFKDILMAGAQKASDVLSGAYGAAKQSVADAKEQTRQYALSQGMSPEDAERAAQGFDRRAGRSGTIASMIPGGGLPDINEAFRRENYGEAAARMATPLVAPFAPLAMKAAKAAPLTTAATLGLGGLLSTASEAGDLGEKYGILKPQLPAEPQMRPALRPDESQMPEKYRANPTLRNRWYAAEVEKLREANERQVAEDKERHVKWLDAVRNEQEKYARDVAEAQQKEKQAEADRTFLERNPWYRYVPLGASVVSGGLSAALERRAGAAGRSWDKQIQSVTNDLRSALASGDASRASQLSANLQAQLAAGRPTSSKLGSFGRQAGAAAIAPEFAAAPTIIDYATPGVPHEKAVADIHDPAYWAKTYAVPLVLGAGGAHTGAELAKSRSSSVASVRGAISEATKATETLGPEQLLSKARDALAGGDLALMGAYGKALRKLPNYKENPEAVGLQGEITKRLREAKKLAEIQQEAAKGIMPKKRKVYPKAVESSE